MKTLKSRDLKSINGGRVYFIGAIPVVINYQPLNDFIDSVYDILNF